MEEIIFKTRRLAIRSPKVVGDDIKFIYNLWENPQVMEQVGFPKGLCTTLEKVKTQLEQESLIPDHLGRVLIVEDKQGSLIGSCKLGIPNEDGVSETDVKLHPSFWGNMYGQEIKEGLIEYLFSETAALIVKATPNINNKASIAMQKSTGGELTDVFIYEFPKEKKHYTKIVKGLVYHVHKDRWLKKKSAENKKVSIAVNDEIRLTEIVESDLCYYLEFFNNKKIHDNFVTDLLPYSENSFYQFLKLIYSSAVDQDEVVILAIRDREDRLVGHVHFLNIHIGKTHDAEIAYWLAEPYWNRGIMTSVVKAAVKYGFEKFQLQRIQAHAFCRNVGSNKVLEKSGFQLEGTLRSKYKKDSEYIDANLYSIINSRKRGE